MKLSRVLLLCLLAILILSCIITLSKCQEEVDEDASIDVETTTTTTTTAGAGGASGQIKDEETFIEEEASIEEEAQEQIPLKQEERVPSDLLTSSPYVSTHSILLDKGIDCISILSHVCHVSHSFD